jgi:putative spermidine/putrescine transport system permease protein
VTQAPTLDSRLARAALYVFCTAVFAFLTLPILTIIPLSLNPGSFLSFHFTGISTRWYQELLTSPQWLASFQNSVAVAVATTLLATPLGTLAALGLARLRSRARVVILGGLGIPMVMPVIITAAGDYFFYAPLGLANSLTGLVLAHTTLAIPYVLVVVSASLEGFDIQLLRAGASLGGSPAFVFRRVLMPLILPGVITGAVFAFMTSFDETVMALFLAGPNQRTLPLQMFDGVREQLSPAILAAATLLIILSSALLAAVELLRRRTRRLKERPDPGRLA